MMPRPVVRSMIKGGIPMCKSVVFLCISCDCSSIKHCFVMGYEIWSSENNLILSNFPGFVSKMKIIKVQFNMVEVYIIVTEVE